MADVGRLSPIKVGSNHLSLGLHLLLLSSSLSVLFCSQVCPVCLLCGCFSRPRHPPPLVRHLFILYPSGGEVHVTELSIRRTTSSWWTGAS